MSSNRLPALALAAALLAGWTGAAQAQADAAGCDIMLNACRAACAAECAGADAASCRQACDANQACLDERAYCREQAGLPPLDPAASEAAAPSGRVMSLDRPLAGGPLEGRIFFLRPRQSEPQAQFYGYLVIGSEVSDARKRAVIEAMACRLEAVDADDAAEIDRLGLVSIPARTATASGRISPVAMMAAYDFDRAERWMRAAGLALGEEFHASKAVLFIGSRRPRGSQLDAVALPGPDADLDPLVADASGLGARYLERWTIEIIDGVRMGSIRSRQDLQTLMETHSWIETAVSPIAALLRITPAEAAPPPMDCR